MNWKQGRHDGKAQRYMGTDGKTVTGDDEDFEQLVRMWEQDEVDGDLVRLARPLLEDGGRREALASRLLHRTRAEYMSEADAEGAVLALLKQEGMEGGHVPHQTEEEFNRAWDEHSGSARGKGAGDFSFGLSDATRRIAERKGRGF